MQQQENVALRVFINRFHQGPMQNLLRFLPQEQAEAIQNSPMLSDDTSVFTQNIKDKIAPIHYSWLVNAIKSQPRFLWEPIVESLTPTQTRGLQRLLDLSPLPQKPSLPIVEPLLKLVWQKLRLAHIMPLSLLPKGPFHELSEWNKSALILLIDLISTYDIADKIRMIVDKKRLQKIMNALVPQQQRFLKIILASSKAQPLRRSFDLERFSGTSEELSHALHLRGIATLAMALSGQPEELILNISHRLDTGRGAILEKNYNKNEAPAVSSPLIQQVLDAMNFISKRES